MKSWRVLGLFFFLGCGASQIDPITDGAEQGETARAKPPVLPHEGGTGDASPWGGPDGSKWRPEATLANATSDALNRGWALAGATDAIAAVPTRMFASTYAEYGDGQLNSVASFGTWTTTERPPLVGLLVRFADAPTKVLLRFDRGLATSATSVTVLYFVGGVAKTLDLAATRSAASDLEAEWTVPAEVGFDSLTSSAAIAIRPKDWADWFPLWFRMPVRPIGDLPAVRTSFSDGKNLVDHEQVGASHDPTDATTPYAKLMSHVFSISYDNQGAGKHDEPFTNTDIHGKFPYASGVVTTAVGGGTTWVADEKPDAYKVLYTCFDARRADLEAAAPQGGVPSGGGWHLIGDSAETILNDLETGPLVVGGATTNLFVSSGLPSGGFAYGLSDVVTVRWLFPGEAFVTPRGGSITDANGNTVEQDNFHWFYFQSKADVCTEEIVSSTVPSNFLP